MNRTTIIIIIMLYATAGLVAYIHGFKKGLNDPSELNTVYEFVKTIKHDDVKLEPYDPAEYSLVVVTNSSRQLLRIQDFTHMDGQSGYLLNINACYSCEEKSKHLKCRFWECDK